jgi:hypothetical protein
MLTLNFTLDESCQQIVFSDASGTGYGGYIVETPIDIAHGMWLDSEKGNSSTWKELTGPQRDSTSSNITSDIPQSS